MEEMDGASCALTAIVLTHTLCVKPVTAPSVSTTAIRLSRHDETHSGLADVTGASWELYNKYCCRFRGLIRGLKAEAAGDVMVNGLEGPGKIYGGLRPTEKEVAVRLQQPLNAFQNSGSRLQIEIDEDVAHEDDVHPGKWRPGFRQVELAKVDHAPNIVAYLPFVANFLKVFRQEFSGEPAANLVPGVEALTSNSQNLTGYIAGHEINFPLGQGREVVSQ